MKKDNKQVLKEIDLVNGDIEPGIYAGIADSDYHAGPGVSSSQLRKIVKDGGAARLDWDSKHPPEDTLTFAVGRAAHSLVLGEGSPVVEELKVDRRTKAGKAEYAQWVESTPDNAIILKPEEYVHVVAAADVLAHTIEAQDLLSRPGGAEQSVYWQDEQTGLLCKCRPDYLPEAQGLPTQQFVDYKTTRKPLTRDGFAKDAANYGYDQAAAWYASGLIEVGYHDNPLMTFVVQELRPPYLVGVWYPDYETVEVGHALNRKALERYAQCLDQGVWPGLEATYGVFSTPRWHKQAHLVEGGVA